MRRLYLHIGHQKTGTTGIQSFLSRNEDRLKEAGVLYPQTGQIHNAHYAYNFSLGIGDYDPSLVIEAPEVLREQLRGEVDASGCETVIISSEYFSIAPSIKLIKDFFSDFDVQVVVYLRRHDYALESAYGQSVKTTVNPLWEPNIDSFVLYQLTANAVLFDYLPALRRWAEHFGKSRITVRAFEREQNVPDLVGDFLGAVGIRDSEQFLRPGELNISIGPEIVTAIQAIRKTAITNAMKQELIGSLIQIGAGQKSCKRGKYLSPSMRTAIVLRNMPSYSVIAREFMGREDGILFREARPRTSDFWERIPEMSQDELLNLILKSVELTLRKNGVPKS